MDKTILNMLDELYDIIDNSKRSLLSSKVSIEPGACLDLIDAIRESLPTELERATNIMNERRQILIDAEEEAKQCIAAAQKNAEEMVSEHEITHAAEEEAKKIIDLARQNAKDTKAAGLNYVHSILDELNGYISELSDDVKENIDKFEKH